MDLKQLRESVPTYFALFSLLSILLAALISGGYYWISIKSEKARIAAKETHYVKMQKTALSQGLRHVVYDVSILVDQVQRHFHRYDTPQKSQISKRFYSEDFFSFINISKIYNRIHLINTDGTEIIRVENNSGTALILPESGLKSLADKTYFQIANKLDKNELYISPIVFAQHQNLEQRPIPIIYFASPVFNSENLKVGVLVLEYLADDLFHKLKLAEVPYSSSAMLLDTKGNWLYKGDGEKRLEFMYQDNKDMTMASTMPDVWSRIMSVSSGQFERNGGLITFETVFPLAELEYVAIIHTHQKKENYRWKIVSYHAEADLISVLFAIRYFSIYSGFALLAMLLGVSWVSAVALDRRKEAEALVNKLSNAVTKAAGSIMITDREGIIEYVNPAFTKITGYTAKEVIGKNPRFLKSDHQNAAYYKRMWDTLLSGNIWHSKVVDQKKDGTLLPVVLSIAPIKDNEGVITHFIGSHTDISELEDMEKQFHQAQKMEAVGTLVGGIAHDFNNMLAGITGNLYLVKKMQENPVALQKLDNIEQLSMRAADMISQLLTFARKDRVVMKQLRLTPFVKETLKFLRTSVPESIQINQDICSDALHITGDATQLHQILMNLINNARDAVEGKDEPSITVRLESFQPDDAFMEKHDYFDVQSYAHLSVEDNGCGIPEYQIEHLFEPFFTTKDVGKGTGLGLAMVFGGVKTHKGFIEVESIEDKGTAFHMYLPLLHQKEISVEASQNREPVTGHGELILIADDELHVRETSAEVLESLGYKVLTAKDGLEAFNIFKVHQREVTIAMLDVVMPHIGGMPLAKQIRQINPDIPVIFITGYDKEHVLSSSVEMANSSILTKPVDYDSLSHLIKDMLHS